MNGSRIADAGSETASGPGDRTRGSAGRPRWRRWVLRGIGLVVAAGVVTGGVLSWLTISPRTDPAAHVDALLVLSTRAGAHGEARRLAEQGVTDLLIVSRPAGAMQELCQHLPSGTQVRCFVPDPVTTQGEAMGGAAIAREHGAHSLGVLTFDHHIERSRLLVERCWKGPVHLYEFQPDRGTREYAYDFVYAMAAYGKAFLLPGCAAQPPQWLQTPIDRMKR